MHIFCPSVLPGARSTVSPTKKLDLLSSQLQNDNRSYKTYNSSIGTTFYDFLMIMSQDLGPLLQYVQVSELFVFIIWFFLLIMIWSSCIFCIQLFEITYTLLQKKCTLILPSSPGDPGSLTPTPVHVKFVKTI